MTMAEGMKKQSLLKNLPLRQKLFLGTSLGTMLVVAATSLVLFGVLHSSVDRDIKNHLSNSTHSILNLVRTSVETAIRNHLRAIAEKNLEIVARFYSLSEKGILSEEEAKSQAAEVLLSQTIGQTGYIFCVSSKGIMEVHPKPGMQGADVSKFPLNKRQRNQKIGYIEYEWANPGDPKPQAKALYMTYFAPWDWIISVSSYRREFSELVQLEDFRDSVLEHKFGDTGYSFVMDQTGKLIIHPTLEGINTATSSDPQGNAFPRDLLETGRGTVVYDWINPGDTEYRKKIAVFDSIPELGWIVASTGYLDEVESPLHLLAYVIVGTTLAMIIALFVMSWWISKVVTQPLPILMKAFSDGSRGNLSLRMDEKLGGEFGKLATYYNRFMDSLEESRASLAESEEKYREIFEQAVEGMFQVNPDGTFANLNPAMAQIFGYSSPQQMVAEVADIAHQVYVHSEDRKAIYDELFEKGKVVGKSIQMLRRDRSIFWGELSVRAVVDRSGEIVLVEGIVKDVTAQHDLMESLSLAQKNAETASQLKSDFLVMVSHEMRTPLTSILGFTQMIKKKLTGKGFRNSAGSQASVVKTLERVMGNLDIVEIESQRLAKHVDDMMEFASLKAGEVLLCIKPTRPIDLAAPVVEAVSATAESKGYSVEFDVEEDLPSVVADHDRIVQVLTHLLNNAVKFTSAGGVALSAVEGDGEIVFAVRDSGPGIPPESVDRVFDHFTQLGDVDTDKPQGAGLGLAVCRSIIALHNGRIWCESEVGQGSVFYFSLPLAPSS
ncbi:cache domain-containing protein [Pseudodesulfovibrio sp. zrk46]|uniref:cache domain-containing protein n=1 Tax=Pseudodesulfovibrio sp. zrk46 TaxID=2725288 RepID=UPI001448B040|nr:cache domain-containing protein [Pseudodesulfovibrio sp. zrk46]QJB56965.1 PAS domain S-box protein [Pseudodesulfovibrio sp. zrk46]